MDEGDYLMMERACEVDEKKTREKNNGIEVLKEGRSPPLDLDPNEIIETDEETGPYAQEDGENPEQIEVTKNTEPFLPFSMLQDKKKRQEPQRNEILVKTTS